MKRKQNTNLPSTSTTNQDKGSQQLDGADLDQANGGSRSSHRHWSDWSRWN